MKLVKVVEQADKLDGELTVLVPASSGNWAKATGKQVRLGYAVKADDGSGEFEVFAKQPADQKSKQVALLGDGDIVD